MKLRTALHLLGVLFLMMLAVPSMRGQSSWDGQFWTTKSRDLKFVYVSGFIDGRNEGANQVAEALGTNISDPKISKLAFNVTVGQIVDGLDEFSKDYRTLGFLFATP
jgi:hypothetical protein